MHLVIGIILCVWWLVCISQPDGKDNVFGKPICPFYQMSEGLYHVTYKLLKKSNYIERLTDRLKILYPNKEGKTLVRQFICYKGSLTIAIICVAVLVSYAVVQNESKETDLKQLKREDYWGEDTEKVLKVEADGVKDSEELTVTISARKHSKEQLQKIMKSMAESLEETVLGDNETLDCVTSDLNLVSQIPDTQVEVTWQMDTDTYIQYNGQLISEAVTEAGAVVNLTATLSYDEEKYQHSFAVHVQKPELSEEEQFVEAIKKEIQQINEETISGEALKLPEELQGKKIKFSYSDETYGYKLLAVFFVCGILVFFGKDEGLHKELEFRKKQMLVDYSEIVSKLTLLLGAGMTIRSALEKIADDYNKRQSKNNGKPRFAYDEILYICREMQGGVSERKGIDLLGKRCQIPCYMKLCSLLLQNLKKGSKGMAECLGYEVGQAFEERKNTARRLGEEAGTKLLVPMIMMLVIVMAILIVPAFLSI